MINLVLAVIALALWGGAYGAYFAPELGGLWRRRRRGRTPPPAVIIPPARPYRPRRPQPTPPLLTVPVRLPAAPAPSNVIAFPRRPSGPIK